MIDVYDIIWYDWQIVNLIETIKLCVLDTLNFSLYNNSVVFDRFWILDILRNSLQLKTKLNVGRHNIILRDQLTTVVKMSIVELI